MDFLTWHYTFAINYYLQRFAFAIRFLIHYFSLPLLIPTLLAPWKRLIEIDTTPGFDFYKYFQKVTFNLVSRVIGAIARLALFITGSLVLILILIFGGLGYLLWLVVPPLSIPIYLVHKKSPKSVSLEILSKVRTYGADPLKAVFTSEPGQFVLARTGLTLADLLKNAKKADFELNNLYPESFSDLIEHFLKKKTWPEEFFRQHGLENQDLVLAANWWDGIVDEETDLKDLSFGSPGVGRELLFGYTPTLNQYSVDLGTPQAFSHHLIGRQNIVSRMERALSSGSSVVLIGPPGVGKRTVVLEFAHRAREGQLGSDMAYRRILELDYNFLFSETTDLNQKRAKLALILGEAAGAGNVILVIRDLHKITNPELEGLDFTDALESFLEKRELKIIAITTGRDYERFIAPNMRLRKYLDTVEVTQPTKDEALQILMQASGSWEAMKNLVITVPGLRKILDGSDRYITEIPFPEKALELLDAVVLYEEQKGEDKVVTVEDVNEVLAEKTGISFARLTESEKKLLGNLEEVIHERLVNQDTAVNLIAKVLRGKTTGVVSTNRPIGSFLFMGPTGVGKTETAKVLAKVYYGSADQILRFDMAEYAGAEGLERLIGSVSKNQPGTLTTAIKNKPASLLLLDEIEKAPADVYNLFLTLLDEGKITDAFDRKINASHLFVVATSNAGAEYIRQLVSRGVREEELQKLVVDYSMKSNIFSPEFINRFDGVVVYEPLRSEDLVKIARLLLSEMASNMKKKNIYIEASTEAVEKLAKEGYDPAFGARPMRRIIDLSLGDLLGKAILNEKIVPGDKIRIISGSGKEVFGWEKIS